MNFIQIEGFLPKIFNFNSFFLYKHSYSYTGVAIFGPPAKIIQDNGEEFSNAEMRAFGEAFSIQLIYTAAESPWSNGVVERLNGVHGETSS